MPQTTKAVHGVYVLVAIGSMLGCSAGTVERHSPGKDVTPSTQAARILDKEEVRSALPGPGDVPSSWVEVVTPELQGSKPEDGVAAFGRSGYAAPDLPGGVGFTLTSFQSRARAIDEFTKQKSQLSSSEQGPVQIPHVDAAFTESFCASESNCSTTIYVRMGSVYAFVSLNNGGPQAADPKILTSASHMFVQRIRQAQQGQQPSAKAA